MQLPQNCKDEALHFTLFQFQNKLAKNACFYLIIGTDKFNVNLQQKITNFGNSVAKTQLDDSI